MNIKKITVATLALSLVSTGTVFASFNAGESFINWYDRSLQMKSDEIIASSSEEMATSISEFNFFLKEENKKAKADIQQFEIKAIKDSKKEIIEHQKRYLEGLESTITELKTVRYQEHVEKEKQKLQLEAEEDVEIILSEVLNN